MDDADLPSRRVRIPDCDNIAIFLVAVDDLALHIAVFDRLRNSHRLPGISGHVLIHWPSEAVSKKEKREKSGFQQKALKIDYKRVLTLCTRLFHGAGCRVRTDDLLITNQRNNFVNKG